MNVDICQFNKQCRKQYINTYKSIENNRHLIDLCIRISIPNALHSMDICIITAKLHHDLQ